MKKTEAEGIRDGSRNDEGENLDFATVLDRYQYAALRPEVIFTYNL